ncbi:hypothetical protein EVAR_7187_1 [Eumeta japonica]|uniref:Uncharacterized protein n=1 Tax=Eumeta variegata TaxID=151549 RepID=A0A4C1U6T9_EUMVA|nr:hypothetical protein EVAR_7187_1 [Eumeta japonica]
MNKLIGASALRTDFRLSHPRCSHEGTSADLTCRAPALPASHCVSALTSRRPSALEGGNLEIKYFVKRRIKVCLRALCKVKSKHWIRNSDSVTVVDTLQPLSPYRR